MTIAFRGYATVSAGRTGERQPFALSLSKGAAHPIVIPAEAGIQRPPRPMASAHPNPARPVAKTRCNTYPFQIDGEKPRW